MILIACFYTKVITVDTSIVRLGFIKMFEALLKKNFDPVTEFFDLVCISVLLTNIK